MDKFLIGSASIFSVIAVLPILLRIPLIKDADCQLCDALRSPEVIQAMIFTFASSIPMLVDVGTFFVHKDSFFFFERVIILAACNIPMLVTYLQRNREAAADVYVCLSSAQLVWIAAALFNGILTSQSKIWKRWRIYTVFLLGCVSQGLTPYTQLGSVSQAMLWITDAAFLACFVFYLVMYCMYLKQVFERKREETESSTDEYLPVLCSTILILYAIGQSLTIFIYHVVYPEDVNRTGLTYVFLMTSVLTILTTLLPGRIASSRVRLVENSLETKKSFVRYIGHEIRTPLNVASIGLDLLATLCQHQPVCSRCKVQAHINKASKEDKIKVANSKKSSEDGSSSNDDGFKTTSAPHVETVATTVVDNFTVPSEKESEKTAKFQDGASHQEINYDSGANTENIVRPHRTQSESSTANTVQDRDTVLQEVRQAIALSTNILNDLLSYEKLDSNNMTVESSYLDIHHLVTSALGMFAVQAEAKQISFAVDIEKDLPVLYADEYKMRQILCNLASNALKFTAVDGTVIVQLKKVPRRPQHYLMIEFHDNGVGIAKKNMSKVFKKIIQFDANTNQAGGGSGLGLYITRGLVELHGGTVSVHSEGLGTGCLFKVRLPFDRTKFHYYPKPESISKMLTSLPSVDSLFSWGGNNSSPGKEGDVEAGSPVSNSRNRSIHDGKTSPQGNGPKNSPIIHVRSTDDYENNSIRLNLKSLRSKPAPLEATADSTSKDYAGSATKYLQISVVNRNADTEEDLVNETGNSPAHRQKSPQNSYRQFFSPQVYAPSDYFIKPDSKQTWAGIGTSGSPLMSGFFTRQGQVVRSARIAPSEGIPLQVLHSDSNELASQSFSGLQSFSGDRSPVMLNLNLAKLDANMNGDDGVIGKIDNSSGNVTGDRAEGIPVVRTGSNASCAASVDDAGSTFSINIKNIPALPLTARIMNGDTTAYPSPLSTASVRNGYPTTRLINTSQHSTTTTATSTRESGRTDSRESPHAVRMNTARFPTLSSTRWLDGLHALLVDDSQSSLKMLSLLLRRHGCSSVTAGDGDAAVAIVDEYMKQQGPSVVSSKSTKTLSKSLKDFLKPVPAADSVPLACASVDTLSPKQNSTRPQIDFILMDNFMPNMCGPVACREMRRLGFHKPILGLTGHALDDDIATYRAAGADDVLVKPLDITMLQTKLKRLIPSLSQG
jgi:signal transduction histidine kinase/CheY-like chemotaxis protein